MPRFAYTARDSRGAALEGDIVAASEREAARLLRAAGKYVIKLVQQDAAQHDTAAARPTGSTGLFRPMRMRPDDVVMYLNQLSIMVDTGVALPEALRGILQNSAPGCFREIQEEVLHDVESGRSFSSALARHPRAFSAVFVNLVRAAEVSGTLGPTLTRCAEHLAYQREVRKRVRSAMLYPLVLVAAATLVTIFLVTYVLPKFTSIYAGKEAILPLPTQWLILISDALGGHFKSLSAAALVFAVGIIWFFRAGAMRPRAHALTLRLPILGPMLRKALLTSSLRTLGMLIDAGVSMLESVAMTRAVVNNDRYERLWADVDARLHRGEQLSAPLYQSPLVPRPLVQMIEAGERAGRLGTVLLRIADHLDRDLRETIKAATQLIEPLMIIVLGVVIGGVSIALLLPILSISKIMGQ